MDSMTLCLKCCKGRWTSNFMRKEHVAIWKVASTAEEAINLLYTTPVWSKEIRKFAAI